ncbi:stealth family protein [Microbacterium terricola]|uniref:Exopolysaccharide phosphotransferase CpsY n=1 Tax=Microbacterium terricola TaxID=344163 RepID=A0ABM8E045_9MICO|nr:stealth family protein [Microbacterium terricola]UYK41107.1 stealth family protein [Microbacterium terricola]BDV31131.1 exopolysaccharide phosphotransferase CpsY [Microbacterium terricola]
MNALTALPAGSVPWSALLDRDDVVLERGILHLHDPAATPDAARTADLLLIADALESAGIAVVLIRHGLHSPALAIDATHRSAAVAALTALGAREPLYVKPKGAAPVLFAEAAKEPRTDALRLFRPRLVRAGVLAYGVESSVRVEFWRTEDGIVHAPRENAVMRRATPAEDVEQVEIERFGRTWSSIAGMFDPHPDEFTADVDIVFSWVDGSSTEFQRQRAARLAEYVVGEGDDGPARYRHVDELRYALRSVHMYAPWVRRIFIATDSPAPAWLLDHPKVTIVRSEEFFADPTVLPTHNSHAVEAQLHRIDGLAEHFLYSNDDMFFGRPVDPELFFTPGGVSKFVECGVRIGTGPTRLERSGHDNALRVNRALLQERFGRVITRDLEHCATPLRRSVMAELEREYADDFARTAASRFRAATDISATNCLYHYHALFTGRAIATNEPRVRYVQTTMASALPRLERLTSDRRVDMFCLNDGGAADVPESVRVRAVVDALERMFPVAGPWERPEVSAVPAAAESAARSGAGR